MPNGVVAHLKSHATCVLGAILVSVIASYVTASVLASADGNAGGQQVPNEEVYMYYSSWPGGSGNGSLTAIKGEAREAVRTACGIALPYASELAGNLIGIGGGVSPESMVKAEYSKPIPDGARLGNFGPPMTCNGSYLFRAEILN